MTSVDIGEGSGWLRLTLRPRDDHRVARVTIESRPAGYGPTINNAADLRRLVRELTEVCERFAVELHPGTTVDEAQGSLFEEAST